MWGAVGKGLAIHCQPTWSFAILISASQQLQRNDSHCNQNPTDNTQLPRGQLLHLFSHPLPVIRAREQEQAFEHGDEGKRSEQIVQHVAPDYWLFFR